MNVVEQLKSEFYRQALAKFHDQDFTNAGYSSTAVPKQILKSVIVLVIEESEADAVLGIYWPTSNNIPHCRLIYGL